MIMVYSCMPDIYTQMPATEPTINVKKRKQKQTATHLRDMDLDRGFLYTKQSVYSADSHSEQKDTTFLLNSGIP